AAAMLAPPAGADAPLLAILRRAVELREVEAGEPESALPTHRAVVAAIAAIERVEAALRALGHRGPLAGHPVRLLGSELFEHAATADDARAVLAGLGRDLATIERGDRDVRRRRAARLRAARRAAGRGGPRRAARPRVEARAAVSRCARRGRPA